MKKIICFLLLCFVLISASSASAQLFLEQGKIKVNVSASENVTESVIIHNTTDKALKLRVYWQDFEYVEPFDGTKTFSAPGTIKNSAGKWINYSPQEFVLAPFGKKDVSVIINAPNFVEGGYYGVLFFEKAPEESADIRGLNIVTRIGCLFFIEASDKTKKSNIQNVGINDSQLTADFANEGNVVLIPQGVYYIMDQDGNAVDRGEIENVYVPPGQKTSYGLEFNKDLEIGKYTIVLTLDFDEGDSQIKEIDFNKISSNEFEVTAARD